MKNVTPGDIAVIIPFAWIISQSIIYGSIFWGAIALFMFNMYVSRRMDW
tara:strand:+ start:985 stop:1131 length:147 start_codon:yes stop_codon:yes gene_type:complete